MEWDCSTQQRYGFIMKLHVFRNMSGHAQTPDVQGLTTETNCDNKTQDVMITTLIVCVCVTCIASNNKMNGRREYGNHEASESWCGKIIKTFENLLNF